MCWITTILIFDRMCSNISRVAFGSVKMVAIQCIEMGDFGCFVGVLLFIFLCSSTRTHKGWTILFLRRRGGEGCKKKTWGVG